MLASYKLDGIRCILYKGQILSRSLKQIQNKQLRLKFEPLRKYSEDYQVILDGEIYSPDLTFQEITSYVMTKDFEDPKSMKKYGHVVQIPDHLKFYCFDSIWNDSCDSGFVYRNNKISYVFDDISSDIFKWVHQETINSPLMLSEYFDHALEKGYEGLILKDPNGRYKCGRGTLKEGLIYKMKPYKTWDAQIIDVIQATKVNPLAAKTTNELGRSVTSKKKDDRILIEKACDFVVKYKDLDLKVVIAMSDEEKEEIWENKESYIGKWIEYKGMEIGSKLVPRHPVMVRWRKDK